MAQNEFCVDLTACVRAIGVSEAARLVAGYLRSFTGSGFEVLADSDRPNLITEADVAAVSTLGVNIPAHVTLWLAGEGQEQVRALLEAVPVGQAIWHDSVDLSRAGPLWELWALIVAIEWRGHHGGMGRTKTSKLLAAKRPHLVPIYDDWVARALFSKKPNGSYWDPWQAALAGPAGAELRDHVGQVVDQAVILGAAGAEELSVLRVIDIVLWRWAKATEDATWGLARRLA